jgi:hypothetical protein
MAKGMVNLVWHRYQYLFITDHNKVPVHEFLTLALAGQSLKVASRASSNFISCCRDILSKPTRYHKIEDAQEMSNSLWCLFRQMMISSRQATT